MLYFQSGYECWCGDSYGRFGLCYIFSLVTSVGVVIPMAGLACVIFSVWLRVLVW